MSRTLQEARALLAGGASHSSHTLDLPDIHDEWEWLYEDVPNEEVTNPDSPSDTRKRKATEAFETDSKRRIVGAQSGSFEVRVGDAIRLKADRNETWVALIQGFVEDEEEEEKMAKFLWFTSGKEIRNKAKRRNDQLFVRREEKEMNENCIAQRLIRSRMKSTSLPTLTKTHWILLKAKRL